MKFHLNGDSARVLSSAMNTKQHSQHSSHSKESKMHLYGNLEVDQKSSTHSSKPFLRWESSIASSVASGDNRTKTKVMRRSCSEDIRNTDRELDSDYAVDAIRADYVPHIASEAVDAQCFDIDINHHQSFVNLPIVKSSNIIVVIPSIDLDAAELKRMGVIPEFYEERQLYHLFLLTQNPSIHIIFVSSNAVDPETIKYYLTIDGCNEETYNERLSRLILLNPECGEHGCSSLALKLLQSDTSMQRLEDAIYKFSSGEKSCCGLSFFCGSDASDAISKQLKIRCLEAKGEHLYFGSKQGARELFNFCDVPCSSGAPDFGDDDLLSFPKSGDSWSLNHRFICKPKDLATGIARQIVYKNIRPRRWIVKLNQGFSGKGNASLSLETVQRKSYIDEQGKPLTKDALVEATAEDIEKEFVNMNFECKNYTWNGDEKHAGFVDQMARLGAIAEALIEGYDITSPSVQLIIEPEGSENNRVIILSTHEQVLDGQVYVGCINPASESYRSRITDYAEKIGEALACQGVVGHFSVDFLACRPHHGGEWSIFGLEINLRQGGTTHPYSALAVLCSGHTCTDGVFRTKEGIKKCYRATDNHIDHRLDGLQSSEFLKAFSSCQNKRVQWNGNTKTGTIFHLFPFLKVGKIGFTCIANNEIEAKEMFQEVTSMMNTIAEGGISAMK